MTVDRLTVSIFLHIDTGVILIDDVNTTSLSGSSRNEGVSDFKAAYHRLWENFTHFSGHIYQWKLNML